MDKNWKQKIALSNEKSDKTGDEQPKSKYFKPGFIFNNNKQKDNSASKGSEKTDFDCDMSDDDDLDVLISQASTKFEQSQSSTSSSSIGNNLNRINQIDSQTVDFTSKNTNTVIPPLQNSNIILVNSNQRQNPLLQNLRAIRYVITDTIAPAHYVLFDSCCALFLSLKYHVIHPNYIYDKISELRNNYQLKILLVMIDHVIYEQSLKELTILAVRTNFTLMLAWNYEEAARHIENYRINAEKPPDIIMGRVSGSSDNSKTTPSTNQQCLIDALTSVKAVNRTDATTLLSTFESFDNLVKSNTDELTICPGISMVKARRLHLLFNKPFIKPKENL